MNSKILLAGMTALGLLCTGAQARQTPRSMEPAAATVERESQLVQPTPPAPPAQAPAAKEDPEADARSKPKAEPSPSDKADARPADPSAKVQRKRPPRRAVEQILTPTPRILGSGIPADAVRGQGMMAGPGAPVSANTGTLTYGPTLETRVPPGTAPPGGTVNTNPSNCSGPNCLDSSGQRLGTGIGSTAITPQGRLCTKGLVGVQCF